MAHKQNHSVFHACRSFYYDDDGIEFSLCLFFNRTGGKIYILNILLRKRYKIAVSVNCCDLRPGIPPVQCFSKSARTASYFQYLHFFIMVQAEQVIILCKENIIKPQLSAEV